MADSSSTIVQPPKDRRNTITVALSARALFDLEAENKFFQENGLEAYIQHMVEKENEVLGKGPAFEFVESALAVNDRIRKLDPKDNELFDIVIVSRNHAQAAIRIINSINHYGLCLERITLAGGTDPTAYLGAWKADLFLSPDENDVRSAIQAGFPAAVVYKYNGEDLPNDQLRIVFDGDAVLFSDEAERVYQQRGFPAFVENERQKAAMPLDEGPLRKFASRIAAIQEKFHTREVPCPIRTYILTARSGASAGKRAILTLREWGLKIDECTFNAGASKAAMLKAINPHLFFDDSQSHIDAALEENIPAARVLYGIKDEKVEAKPAAEKSKKRGRESVESEGAKGTLKEHFPVKKTKSY
ncbi:PREDICTED: cytosolic 5'-nucleotidase 1A-like [Branchiostoma belcheri]|uniref:Cytosolic 5'-nucleotidase 1A-like n=1 Tax=Branchiostoma belcheri TaxID=7741 RepID=A0A6P4ZVC6_BRABE|nr:PREDICTED: cytosolic 5'-nucleotidase 1A-like [Branchiostoma belcheri]